MNTFALEIALAGALLAPAQQAPNPGAVTEYVVQNVTSTLTARAGRPPVYEEIEVMRALLLRKLRSTYFGPERLWWSELLNPNTNGAGDKQNWYFEPITTPDGKTTYRQRNALNWVGNEQYLSLQSAHSPHDSGISVEGVYLDGYGVVFNVVLPASAHDPRPAAPATPSAQPPSEWDEVRRELRGEGRVPPPTSTGRKEPTLGDVLLHLLAENGKHFTSLRDDQQLTVAVTFRGAPHPYPLVTFADPVQTGQPGGQPAAPPGAFTAQRAGSVTIAEGNNAFSAPQTGRDLELLGELHLKQGQNGQALEAFQRALAQLENEAKSAPDAEDDRQVQSRLAELYTKLAQAQTATGRLDEARTTLDRAVTLKQRGTAQTANKAPQPPRAAAAQPAKLIVSAPKRLLDQVGGGKVTFEEFRKAAKVEYIPAAGAPKAPEKK